MNTEFKSFDIYLATFDEKGVEIKREYSHYKEGLTSAGILNHLDELNAKVADNQLYVAEEEDEVEEDEVEEATYQITICPSTGTVLHFQSRLQGWTELEGTVYPTLEAAEAAIEDAIESIYKAGFSWWAGDRPAVRIEETGEDGRIVKTIPIPRVY